MKIIIPTRHRTSKQGTLGYLSKNLYKDVVLVCPENEVSALQRYGPELTVIAQPDPTVTIAQKRKWIFEELCAKEGWEKIVMVDDDIRFCIRRPGETSILNCRPSECEQAFQELEEQLSPNVPHASFAARQGAISDSALRGGWQLGKRMMYVLAYHVPTLLANAELGRIETREDFDITLQLLRKGFPNSVSYTYYTDQMFAKAGGCTGERTMERSNADAYKLAELHPGYVVAEQKDYVSKVAIPRVEVRCAWVKAYKEADMAHLAVR